MSISVVHAVLLIVCLGATAYYVYNDIAEYARFKLLTDTAARQHKYLVWVRQSFMLFTCLAIICLAVIGRLRALTTLPPEFSNLAQDLLLKMPKTELPSTGFLLGFGGAIIFGGVISGIVIAKINKKNVATPTIGDIEALLPRNGPETACTALLSLNAGLGEELFFRLLLPLLLTLVTGYALLAFAIAALIFGLAHIYQGSIGVLATTILGCVFTALYLWTGNIWIAVCVHAGFDLIGLVLRPTIIRTLSPEHAPR